MAGDWREGVPLLLSQSGTQADTWLLKFPKIALNNDIPPILEERRYKCPSVDKWIKVLWVHGHKKKKTIPFCDSMDGPDNYYTKWNKSVRERHIPYDLTYMWNLMNKIN